MPLLRKRHPARLLLATLLIVAAYGEQTTQPTAVPAPASYHSEPLLELNYEGFTVWPDCARRGPVRFQYTLTRDQGNRQLHILAHSDHPYWFNPITSTGT